LAGAHRIIEKIGFCVRPFDERHAKSSELYLNQEDKMSNTALTKEQRKALARVQKRLTASFKRSLKRMSKAGNARTWMVPYLKKMLAQYRRARKKIIDGAPLTSVLGHHRHDFFAILLRQTSNRDARARSRWASTMKKAVKSKIRPADLKDWLKVGGGISGRAK
jgi:hypothetical protein